MTDLLTPGIAYRPTFWPFAWMWSKTACRPFG
ncbi:hypothetical protein JOF29_003567 [Kribbella aluminosa]|uniref:Uncharacterized protein n=1 Tax=Kribbella aluminosa TaxID=416017 RepID=A0ABS4ULJ3_9ACTN|nr:hypothetical protein [Kribbella aluminosa]